MVAGLTDTFFFLANVRSKGTSQTFSPPHCYSRPPLLLRGSPVYFSTPAHSSLSTAPTSLIFHLITYSFTFIFQAEKDLREWSWKQLAQGEEDGACQGVHEHEGGVTTEPYKTIQRTKDWKLFIKLDFVSGFCSPSLSKRYIFTGASDEVIFWDLFVQVRVWQKQCVSVRKCGNQGIPHTDRAYLTTAPWM